MKISHNNNASKSFFLILVHPKPEKNQQQRSQINSNRIIYNRHERLNNRLLHSRQLDNPYNYFTHNQARTSNSYERTNSQSRYVQRNNHETGDRSSSRGFRFPSS